MTHNHHIQQLHQYTHNLITQKQNQKHPIISLSEKLCELQSGRLSESTMNYLSVMMGYKSDVAGQMAQLQNSGVVKGLGLKGMKKFVIAQFDRYNINQQERKDQCLKLQLAKFYQKQPQSFPNQKPIPPNLEAHQFQNSQQHWQHHKQQQLQEQQKQQPLQHVQYEPVNINMNMNLHNILENNQQSVQMQEIYKLDWHGYGDQDYEELF